MRTKKRSGTPVVRESKDIRRDEEDANALGRHHSLKPNLLSIQSSEEISLNKLAKKVEKSIFEENEKILPYFFFSSFFFFQIHKNSLNLKIVLTTNKHR